MLFLVKPLASGAGAWGIRGRAQTSRPRALGPQGTGPSGVGTGDTWKLLPDIFPDCGKEAWAQIDPENWDLKSWVCDHGEVGR